MALSGNLTAGYWYADNGQSRGYTLNWSATQSIANNQSTITWWVDTAGTYPYQVAERTLIVTLAGQTLINKSDRVMRGPGRVASGSFTVNHASDGTYGFTGSIQAAVFTSAVNCSNDGTFALNKIPRQATISNAPNFNDETTELTITYSNLAGNSVTSLDACISLTGAKDDISYRPISKTGTSFTFNLTEDEILTLVKATTGSNSRTVKFYVRTIIGDTTFHSILDRTFTIINGTPTLSPSVVDTNDATIDLTGDNNILVRYFSKAHVVSGEQVYKEATVESQYVLCGNQRINEGNGTIENISSGSFIFSVTDNRENTVLQTVNVPIIEYVNLTCNLNANAPDGEGDMLFSVSGNGFVGSFGLVDNSIKVYYRYKTDDEDYEDWIEAPNVTLKDNNTYVAIIDLHGLDYQKRYTFQARAADKLMDIESVERVVKAVPVFDWGENDFNFNVPVLIKGVTLLDMFYPVGSIYISIDETSPAELFGGTWQRIEGRFLYGCTSTETVGLTGGASTHKHDDGTLIAAIGSGFGRADTLAFCAGSTDHLAGHSPTYTLQAPTFANNGWSHSTAVYGYTGESSTLPPHINLAVWKRIA